jgi:hypothetical protein
MTVQDCFRGSGRGLAAACGFAAGAYATYVAFTWAKYGQAVRPSAPEQDSLLDRYMPRYDVVERHHTRVDAPASVTLEAARNVDLLDEPIVRAIFRGRDVILGAQAGAPRQPKGLLDEVLSLGWVVLDETPGREIVVGAVTKPWEPNPVFRSIPAGEFAAFAEPQYVKIAWTLRADPLSPSASIFRTETRALATDDYARNRFRAYWSLLSPGIWLIRRMMLRPIRKEAARRAAAA